MKRLFLLGLALSIFALPSRAQSSADASIGYSYFHLGGDADLSQNGISGSVAYKPIPYLGIVGDFGGYHASPGGVSFNTYTYMFGPRVILHNPTKFTPFVQFLAGAGHLTVGDGGGSMTNFAYSVGGGVDVGILPHLALRPELDYIGLHNASAGGTANCTRVSVSAVVRF